MSRKTAQSGADNHALYLLVNRLRTGDVILSQGGEKESDLIATITGGPYSHAALFYRPSHGDLGSLFESLDDGIGFRPFPASALKKVERDMRETRMFVDVSLIRKQPYRAFAVFRHPKFGGKNTVARVFRNALEPFWYREYPRAEQLAAAASLPKYLTWFISRLLASYDDEPKTRPGPFCSQLIVAVYERLGVRLFGDDRDCFSVSPNDLAGSQLRECRDVWGTPNSRFDDDLKAKERFMKMWQDHEEKYVSVREAVKFHGGKERFEERFNRVKQMFEDLGRRMKK
jgi:hypothetical protein